MRMMVELGERASLGARVTVRDRMVGIAAHLEHLLALRLHDESAQHGADAAERPVLDDRLHESHATHSHYAAFLAAILLAQ